MTNIYVKSCVCALQKAKPFSLEFRIQSLLFKAFQSFSKGLEKKIIFIPSKEIHPRIFHLTQHSPFKSLSVFIRVHPWLKTKAKQAYEKQN